ncbi:hypothetical protein [Roseiflexus castenholzii]|jgi:hypothetical protein|uniref:Uncharacterized protein n=1 Tax=Roseiflexus castenholzii (strain DSM 13941 / HLO8) TaxID=383372 RepID=A7NF53_ROSCS|nr:hypothetical protein [Roseiflexus castenholzii]ABU58228.1 conserved hypothetical protein [Roseiflexus castenholzii DSM 13941]
MTTLPSPHDAIADSAKLIAILERHYKDAPEIEALLNAHRATHSQMTTSYHNSEEAIAAWRAALARRWTCEITARRLYKQTLRQLVQHYGTAETPTIRLISRGGAEADSTPTELLEDMRRLHAVLSLEATTLPFAEQRLAEIAQACATLERAIDEVAESERQRRTAVLDLRIAREVYRRMRRETCQALMNQIGDRTSLDLIDESLVETTDQ